MDPSPFLFDALLSPQAVYLPTIFLNQVDKTLDAAESAFATFSLKKKQITSQVLRWRCDGFDVDKTRFFALPEFAIGRPPLRIDVYLPDPWDPSLQYNKHVAGLQLWTPEVVLRVLERWSNQATNFENTYLRMPFGSRITIADVKGAVVHLDPVYDAERQSMNVDGLATAWGLCSNNLPPCLDLSELRLQNQPHEAISIITIPKKHGTSNFVFKSATRGWQYLYHEIKMLLTIPESVFTQGRPLYLVIKKSNFGGKLGVYGFVQRLEPMGSLCQILQRNFLDDVQIDPRTQYRWAIQVTSAMIHIQNSPGRYYPDLKTENVLITGQGEFLSAYLIDFEQRGGWPARSPPEVYYIDYLEEIALSKRLPVEIAARYAAMLRECFPSTPPRSRTSHYDGSVDGFSLSWLVLNTEEREAAMVYTLGKLLWCIFELQASVNCGLGIDLFSETNPAFRFPEFRRTPSAIRECIRGSTAGAPEWGGRTSCFRLHKTKLYPVGDEDPGRSDIPTSMQKSARAWWQRELDEATEYVEAKKHGCDTQHLIQSAQRPKLSEILGLLDREARIAQ